MCKKTFHTQITLTLITLCFISLCINLVSHTCHDLCFKVYKILRKLKAPLNKNLDDGGDGALAWSALYWQHSCLFDFDI